jgi:hypothetical protein
VHEQLVTEGPFAVLVNDYLDRLLSATGTPLPDIADYQQESGIVISQVLGGLRSAVGADMVSPENAERYGFPSLEFADSRYWRPVLEDIAEAYNSDENPGTPMGDRKHAIDAYLVEAVPGANTSVHTRGIAFDLTAQAMVQAGFWPSDGIKVLDVGTGVQQVPHALALKPHPDIPFQVQEMSTTERRGNRRIYHPDAEKLAIANALAARPSILKECDTLDRNDPRHPITRNRARGSLRFENELMDPAFMMTYDLLERPCLTEGRVRFIRADASDQEDMEKVIKQTGAGTVHAVTAIAAAHQMSGAEYGSFIRNVRPLLRPDGLIFLFDFAYLNGPADLRFYPRWFGPGRRFRAYTLPKEDNKYDPLFESDGSRGTRLALAPNLGNTALREVFGV